MKVLALAALAGLWTGGASHAATVFNLENDFSPATNSPTGVWSYRYQNDGLPNNLVRDGNYELLPDPVTSSAGGATESGWAYVNSPTWPGLPLVAKNISGTTYTSGSLIIPAGQIVVHPSVAQLVAVSWLAPSNDTVAVSFRFSDLDNAGANPADNGISWYVDHGDAFSNLAAGSFAPGGDSGLITISNVSVTAGDRLNFVVDPQGSEPQSIYFDSTRVYVEIVATGPPAPPQTAPVIVSVRNDGNTAVRVIFSVPVQPASAANRANYALTNLSGNVAIVDAAFGADSRTVRLTTASQLPYASHWLTINRVADAATGSRIIAANSQGTYTNAVFNKGYATRQLYWNLGSGTAVSDLTGSVKFPDSPDQEDYPPALGWPQENIANQYGGRMLGLLVAPASGQYSFALRSQDNAQLFLSTNGNPACKALLTQEPACCHDFDTRVAGPVTLVAGQRCYLEALMKAGTGGDYLYVAWKTPLNNSAWTVISGEALGNFNTNGNASLAILRQPTNMTVMASQSANFSLLATGASVITTNITCQWQVNGLDIPSANSSTYTTPPVSETDQGAVYRALVSVPGKAQFSATAVLTVTPDIVPPTVVQVLNFGDNNVLITFSEPVEAASATNIANYAFTNGLAVTVGMLLSNTAVMLGTGPLVAGSNYSLVINRVRDRALLPNTIATNTRGSFTATLFTPATIGGATPPGSVIALTNGLDVSAGGSDIGGRSDQCEFNSQVRFGDFDVRVRLESLGLSSPWAKAGLMAREAFDPGSRFAGSFATPGLMGSFFESRTGVGSLATMAGSFPVNYPDTWLRLQRIGSVFTGYASLDGVGWTQLGSVSLGTNTVYVGLTATSYDTNQLTLARFRGFSDVTHAIASPLASPREPLGPSSRRTGFSISEIMYKPAPRADGQNLEFIELFNSYSQWEDLSGYHLTGGLIDFTFPPGTIIQAGGFIVVAAAPAGLRDAYGITNVVGPYTGSLKKSGLVQLNDNAGTVLLEIPYSKLSPWPVAADGTGYSIVLARPSYGAADGRAWAISDVVGGSPGGYDAYHPGPLRDVLINELMPHSGTNLLDFVELYNHSASPVDISGCLLSDDPLTNKFVIPAHPPTILPAGGFISFNETQMGFGLNAAGETVFLKNPEGTRILDAVAFEPQALGISYGRWPDGASDFYPLAVSTPGTNNSALLLGDVVINEIMYHPISGNDDDGYVELYNKGAAAVDVGGWRLAGLTKDNTFAIPTPTILAPDGYLVLARNRTNLFARYPNLNSLNTVGDYPGHLPHGGARLTLARSVPLTGTNTTFVVVDEVTYGTGGRWGQWSDGGGSSLELIHPDSNHRLSGNWADSDETAKSAWTNLVCTGVLDLGATYGSTPINFVQLGLLGAGECLVDNVEVLPGGPTASPNYVSNPTFESGLTGWTPQGAYIRSSVETSLGGYQSAASLHLRGSDSMWTLDNSVQGTLNNASLASGQAATLRLKARWLRGWPEAVMRLRGNWLEATGTLPLPPNLGSPGLKNSRYAANAGPAIYEVRHFPAVPPANQPVMVIARFHDLDGFTPTLLYRMDVAVNPTPSYVSVLMTDNATGGDAVAGDGLYSATIPAQPAGTVVAFLVRAQDVRRAATIFPADPGDNSGIPRECVVGFGDPIPTTSFLHHHVWMTRNWINRWSSLGGVSNEMMDGTFADGGGRIIYNWSGRFAGSPYHRYAGSPVTTICNQQWAVPADDLFLGASSLNKQHLPGNGPLDDDTLMREQISWWMARRVGLPWQNRRYYIYYVNGNRHGPVMEDSQVPGGDMINQHWPNDSNGWLYKCLAWFEGDTGLLPDTTMNFETKSWCTLGRYTTTVNGTPNQYKLARYRWPFVLHQSPDSANNYSSVFALVDAANTVSSPTLVPDPYDAALESLVDTEEWMRLSAMEHATGDFDSFFYVNQWNMFLYKPIRGKWTALKWDWNVTLGNVGWGPDGGNLFNVGANDPIMAAFQNHPAYRRAYLRAFQDIANLAMNNTYVDPVMDATYAAFVANGLTAVNYGIIPKNPGVSGGLKSWIATMHDSLVAALASQGVANVPFTGGSPSIVSNNLLTLSGVAPIEVKTLLVNGAPWPLTWTTATNWKAVLPAIPGAGTYTVTGFDGAGQPVSGASYQVSFVYYGPAPSPVGTVVINEIMCAPALPGAEYVELYNASTNFIFDLSGWVFHGLNYTFPAGSLLKPGSYLVLAKDRLACAAAYGASLKVFDEFSGNLQAGGEAIALIQPGVTTSQDVIIDKVNYDSVAPWPSAVGNTGASLQLIDPAQDNSRVCNWSAGDAGWRFVSLTGVPGGTRLIAYLDAPGDVYLDDVSLVFGTVAATGSNYVRNAGFEQSLTGIWRFIGTTNSALTTSVSHWGTNSLHLVVGSPAGASVYLYQDLPATVKTNTCTLGFWYRPSAAANILHLWMSSSFAAQAALRQVLNTPGIANSVAATLPPIPPLWINEVLPLNLSGLLDGAGEHEPWIELYNAGSNTIALDGLYLSDNYTNLGRWAFPQGSFLAPGQFRIVFADGQPAQGTPTELHASFRLAAGDSSVALSRLRAGQPEVLDYLNYNGVPADFSYGSVPDGQPFDRQLMFYPTPGGTNNGSLGSTRLSINEWMADNTHSLPNPIGGAYDDWFELHNANAFAVDLAGWSLANSLTNATKFVVPGHYVVPAGGFFVVWADNQSGQNSTNRSDLHVNFKLSKSGDTIALFDPNRRLVDSVSFGAQATDVSEGRSPHGGTNIYFLTTPTPGRTNLHQPAAAAITVITVEFAPPNQQVTLTFTTTPGLRCQVEFSENLTAWAPLGQAQTATDASLTVLDPSAGGAQRFYRVMIVP